MYSFYQQKYASFTPETAIENINYFAFEKLFSDDSARLTPELAVEYQVIVNDKINALTGERATLSRSIEEEKKNAEQFASFLAHAGYFKPALAEQNEQYAIKRINELDEQIKTLEKFTIFLQPKIKALKDAPVPNKSEPDSKPQEKRGSWCIVM